MSAKCIKVNVKTVGNAVLVTNDFHSLNKKILRCFSNYLLLCSIVYVKCLMPKCLCN